AAYLLQCQGYHVDMQANLADPEFLVHQLELREGLEQIAEKKIPESQLDGLVQQTQCLQKKEREFFVACFEQLLHAKGSAEEPAILKNAYDSLLKLRFIEKLFEEIDVLRHSLLD
ncbi:MAG TPA: iron-sulfur cluster co-chaperone HscB C-terminal domain-containing protein, partial [Pseudomonadales bacterium]|nr:iron-sulfur cluster co-chaperone HscB C-terminal domain-containing protein [Pseudomonadales bacterium]